MLNRTMTHSQSHGGTLYYVYQVPRDEYHNSGKILEKNSTESGWDNPFRPGGDLSREADEIVNLIKGGKPITPNGDYADQTLLNGDTPKSDALEVTDGATKLEVK